MQGLIILCLAAVALAAPQYSYQPGVSGVDQGTAGSASGVSSGLVAPGSYGSASGNLISSQQPTIYNKQFYIHSAPDDDLDTDTSNQGLSAAKRNLRVVFIKSPENKGLEHAALQLAKTASEDRTAIYVLNKQTDLSELQNKLNQIQDLQLSKPEVHFVKYKTPQEAEHAQHTIQSQYDQLGGPSHVSNEGIAPVRSFIGSLGSPANVGAASNTASVQGTAYLPPQYRH